MKLGKIILPILRQAAIGRLRLQKQARKWDNEAKIYRDIDDQREWDSMVGADVDDMIDLYRAE